MPADPELNPAPQPRGFEERFQHETRVLLGQRFRLSFTVGIVLYLAFSVLDWHFAPDHWESFLVMRLVVAAVAGCGIWLTLTPWGRRHVLPLSFATLSLASLVLSTMTAMLDGFSSTYFYGNMLVLFLVGLFMPWRPGVTLTFCALVTCGYFIVNLWQHPLELEAVLPFFFLLGTCALTFLGSIAIERSRRKDLRQTMEIESSRDKLRDLDEAKTSFFANVSHELRTPLMMILAPLEQLLAETREPHLRSTFESMELASRRLHNQINMILDFSKIEAGGAELSLQAGNVGEVLIKLVRAAEPAAEARKLRLESEGLDEIPNALFDVEKVETIGNNLVANAMKFTGEGGRVTVRGGVRGKRIWFQVEDTGVGIPPEQLDRIFERFHQVEGGGRRKVQGTGLGLALAREFARMHGGDITVKSQPRVGTSFTVELPLQPVLEGAESLPSDEGASSVLEGRISQTDDERSRGKTAFAALAGPSLRETDQEELATRAGAGADLVLVVEDNDDVRNFIANQLSRRYRVAVARDGEEGLRQADKLNPALIVSDVMMPKLDGMGMLQRLREARKYDNTPVILVTARTGADSVVHGLRLGAVDYVTKPFKFSELEARIEAQLRMVRTQRELDERESRLAAVGQMASSIAHDLRNPLTAVLLRTEALRRALEQYLTQHASTAVESPSAGGGEESAEFFDDLSRITASVKRASTMVTDLMEFLRGHEIQLDLESTSLRGYLDQLAAEQRPSIEAAGLDLVVEVEPPDLRLHFDRERMRRVLENLLRNAREAVAGAASERGGRIWLQAYVEGCSVILRVADNGPGVPPHLQSKLFEPFETANKKRGTGLGLSIAHNLVAAHGGTLELEERPPEGGAAFRIVLGRDQSFWEGLAEDPDSGDPPGEDESA